MFPGKVGLCLICVAEVTISGEDNPGKDGEEEDKVPDQDGGINEGGTGTNVIEEDTFLKGLSILCEKLGADEKFGTSGFWELVGVDKWARLVCCWKCYGMLRELVRLQELIRATQISLDDKVDKLENCLKDSAESYPDSEFSFNSCFLFRREILAVRLSSSSPGQAVPRTPAQRKRRNLSAKSGVGPSTASSSNHGKRPRVLITPEDYDKLNSSFVKLEKLEGGEIPGNSMMDDDDNIPPSPLEYNDKNDSGSEQDVKPGGQGSRRGRCPGRKRGRPKKLTVISKEEEREEVATMPVKSGRGRPRRTSNDKLVHNDPGDPEIKIKRGRGRPSKRSKILPEGDSEDELGGNDNDELFDPNLEEVADFSDDNSDSLSELESEDEYQQEPVREKAKRKSKNKYKPRNSGRPAGRPRKKLFPITVEQAKSLINDNSSHIRPMVVIDPEAKSYSYHNVPIQQEDTRLICKYPGCDFSVGEMAYFSEQLGFRTMKLHVKHFHRLQNYRIYTNSENEKSSAPGDAPKTTLYFCCYCDAHFPAWNNLLDHVRNLHATAQPLLSLCEVCGDTMPQKQLASHLLTHKNSEEKELALKAKSKRRGRHKDTSTPLHFPCDECPKFFKNHTLLRLHKVTHIPLEIRKQFQCDMCGERLASHNLLRYHKQRVHFKEEMEYPFVCQICNEKFNKLQKTDYQVHLRLHTGERPYQCSECGKDFHRKRNLVVHEQLHLDNKIQCEYCAQWYKNVKYLRRHHLKHHSDLVRKPNRRPNNDKYHRTAVYGPDFIGPRIAHPCEPCGKVYVFKSQLISHMKHGHKLFLPKSEDYPDQNTFEIQEMRESSVGVVN